VYPILVAVAAQLGPELQARRRGAGPMSRARGPGAGKRLSLENVATLLERAYGADDVAAAVAELEALSPAWRRGIRALRGLTRECRHPDYELVLVEARAAPALARRLAELSYPQQLLAVETEERYHTWGLCRLLQLRSAEIAASDAAAAARLAALALRIPPHLGEKRYDVDFVQDLLALSWCYLGHAWRELGELHSAGDAMDLAEGLRRQGSGYRDIEAEALVLRALLHRDRHGGTVEMREAVALLDRAEAIYSSAPGEVGSEPDLYDPDRHAEARVHRGWCLYHLGEIETAAGVLEAAIELMDEVRQPRLALAARCGLVWCSLGLGKPDAEERLAAAFQLAERVGDEADRLRLFRARARLDLELGERGPAEQVLRATALRLLELDLAYDAALTYLDLAALYVDAGELEAVRWLAKEILPVFSSREVHQEAMAALLLFQQACEIDRLAPGLLVKLAALLERERKPSLAWWPAANSMPAMRLMSPTDPNGRTGDAGAAAPG
jgi:tetratricopeptide (TPR) repeat protein